MGLDILYRDGKIRKGYGGIILGDYCLGGGKMDRKKSLEYL